MHPQAPLALPEAPPPDFADLDAVLRGSRIPTRLHVVELLIDDEVLQALWEGSFGRAWSPPNPDSPDAYFEQIAEIYRRLGYDAVVLGMWGERWLGHPPARKRRAADTAAALARDARDWVDEKTGLIDSRNAMKRFPWDSIEADYRSLESLSRALAPDMKVLVSGSLFEHVTENLLGFEGLFLLLQDDPELVEAVFTRWGAIVLDFYRNVADLDAVGGFWHADDLGYRTATLLSPSDLARLVFPWFQRYARVAHERGKLFLLHSCGNYYDNGVIETLIDSVGIDGLHSYQNAILPAAACLQRYGKRIAVLGGVDMDVLARGDEQAVRRSVRNLLARCGSGRFALSSGNTIANYVPVANYLAMLDEGWRWRP